MQRYSVVNLGFSDLNTLYPHTPTDYVLSLQEYLEAQLADGWELVSLSVDGSPWFVFRASGRNS